MGFNSGFKGLIRKHYCRLSDRDGVLTDWQ